MYDQFNPNFYAHLEDDSAMIQAAVDAAAQTGDAVTIPRRNERTGKNVWDICRAILLHTGSVLYLDNCKYRVQFESLSGFELNRWMLSTKCFIPILCDIRKHRTIFHIMSVYDYVIAFKCIISLHKRNA